MPISITSKVYAGIIGLPELGDLPSAPVNLVSMMTDAHATKEVIIELDTRPVKDGFETDYRILTGVPERSATARLGVYPAATANGGEGKVNVSLRIETWDVWVDLLGQKTYTPRFETHAWSMWGTNPSPNHVLTIYGLLRHLSFLVPTHTVEGQLVLEDSVLADASYGVTKSLVLRLPETTA